MASAYKILNLALFTALFIIPSSLAQEKLKDKIEKIEGSVEKIVITSDGKDYTFQGNDAKELFDKIKKKSSHDYVWTTSDSAAGNENVYIIKTDGDDKEIEIESEGENKIIIKSDKDIDDDISGIRKKVKIEVDNGNKKVTVTTTENGEAKTEVYEGKEADEYIDKMKANDDDLNIIIENGKDKKKVKEIIIETEKEEKNK